MWKHLHCNKQQTLAKRTNIEPIAWLQTLDTNQMKTLPDPTVGTTIPSCVATRIATVRTSFNFFRIARKAQLSVSGNGYCITSRQIFCTSHKACIPSMPTPVVVPPFNFTFHIGSTRVWSLVCSSMLANLLLGYKCRYVKRRVRSFNSSWLAVPC